MHSGDMIFVATVMLLAPIGLSIYLVCCWKKIIGRRDGNSVEGTVQQEQQHQRYVEYVFFCEELFLIFLTFLYFRPCGSTLPTTRCQGATTR